MRLFGRDEHLGKDFARGTHRAVSPAQTLARFTPLMPRLGITRLAEVTGLDHIGLPVWIAVRPNGRSLSTAQGKGIDEASAKASALMESIESWHAERAEPKLRVESWRALAAEAVAVDLDGLARVAAAPVPRDAPLLWAEGWDLVGERPAWVPFESVSLNLVPPASGRALFAMGSNGLASGNHVLEATVHALCEVVERDAAALARLAPPEVVAGRRVDLDTVDDAVCRELLDRLARAAIAVSLWDQTSDTDVPSYAASICERPDAAYWRRVGGAAGHGCHLDPAIAMARALSEAVQARLTVISGSRDDLFHERYRASSSTDALERAWERHTGSLPRRDARERTSGATPTFEGDLERLVAAVRSVGVEHVVVVDLTRPDVGVPVVKVVVPGLESGEGASQRAPGARARARAAALR